MFKKQVIAQVGVFLLLGLNVAAYWFLWPNYHNVSSNEGKAPTQEKGTTRLVPEAPAKSLPPKEISPSSLKDAIPLSIPASAPPVEPKNTQEKETLSKLFDHIKNENAATPPPQITQPIEALPVFEPAGMKIPDNANLIPRADTPVHADNVPAIPRVAVASALTPRCCRSPWLLSMEMVGNRTQLLAKLRPHGSAVVLAEFKILRDRVEMKSPGGELQALGKVTVVGPGLNASCQRMILPMHETRLTFEEQAQIAQAGVAGSVLRGERITWELPANAASVSPNPIAPPGEFRPADILPPALGLPK